MDLGEIADSLAGAIGKGGQHWRVRLVWSDN